jgi:hypothetical protein
LSEVNAWPGGGLQLAAAAGGEKIDPSDVRVVRQDGSGLPLEVASYSESAGITAILVAPDLDEATHDARVRAARALIAGLPSGERIGLWLASESLPLVSELSDRREHVSARLDAIVPAQAQPLVAGALSLWIERLMRVSAPWGPISRSLIVVGGSTLAAADVPALGRNRIALAFGLLREAGSKTDRDAPLAKYWSRKQTPEDAGIALAHELDALRTNMVRIGTCSELTAAEPLALEYAGARVLFQAPSRSADVAALPCDAAAAARDDYPIGETVTLELTAEELALHDRYDQAKDETEFTLHVRIGDAAPIAARAHFRGQTSLDCGRKSYSIHFTDDAPRRFGRHAFGSEFYLLSLCKDPGGFRQVLANRSMAQLQLFPLEQRYVQLRVAGRERGIYLLLEKPDEYLKRNQAALSAVIRRRFDATAEPAEVKYPKPDREPEAADAALQSYTAIVEPIAAHDSESLFETLSERVDLDNYLRWLALQSFFQCGDYVDETFFYASDESGAPYFRNLGWDTDDLFELCHHKGKYAYRDVHELVYCAEGTLDQALGVSSSLYHRYAEVLAELMHHELDPERVASELDSVRDDLLGRLVDDEVCVGTGEFIDQQPATCERLRPRIDALMDEFRTNMRARAELLRTRLFEYGVEP